jgi:hypothetical protein
MSLDSLILLLLLVGFVATPFASLTVQRTLPRVAAAILLTATLSILGCFAYAFDRNSAPNSAWWCLAAMLMGVAICARVFIRHKARFALILSAAFICTIAGLHFFGADFPRTCLRVQSSIHIGMTSTQVQSVISREFAKCANYRMVSWRNSVPERGFGSLAFEFRPDYINLQPGSLQVAFTHGRVTEARTTFESIWLAPWDLLGGIILWGICWWQLGRVAEPAAAPRDDIDTAFGRLAHIRTLGYRVHPDRSAVLAKKTLMHSASEKVRQFAYFGRSTEDSETTEMAGEDDGTHSVPGIDR